eukprot:1193379-Rhodomonas_salina.1
MPAVDVVWVGPAARERRGPGRVGSPGGGRQTPTPSSPRPSQVRWQTHTARELSAGLKEGGGERERERKRERGC